MIQKVPTKTKDICLQFQFFFFPLLFFLNLNIGLHTTEAKWSMEKKLILLDTIRDLSAGISQQEQHFHLDNLMNPLILNPDVNNLVDPVGMNVGQPENQPITLSHFASDKILNAISKSIEKY